MLEFIGRPVVRMVLVGIVVLGLQTTIVSEVRPFGVALQLMLLLATVSGVVGGPERGAVSGFVFGILYDMTLTTPLGLAALSCAVGGLTAGYVQSITVTPPRWLAALFVGLGSAVGELAFPLAQALVGQEGWVEGRIIVVIPVVAVANLLLAPPLIPLARWWLRIPKPL